MVGVRRYTLFRQSGCGYVCGDHGGLLSAQGYVINLAADLEPEDVHPWAVQAFEAHLNDMGMDDPGTVGCQPLGPRHITGGGLVRMAQIVQTPALILVLYEDLHYRQIDIAAGISVTSSAK